MSQAMGSLDFFMLESSEYLERLDSLAQTPAGAFPQGDDFLRLTRAFRGSALMANQQYMARAAQGLEAVARAVREGRLAWTDALRGEVVRAVDDCKILLRRVRTPEPGDSAKAEELGARLDRLSGRASAQLRAAHGPGLDAGGRAFVAREAASIASVLSHVARTLQAEPANRDVLAQVGPAMSALRGVAILNDLPPLGDLLAAVENVVKEVLAAGRGSPDAAELFEAAARALARAAREVVDRGRPEGESEEARAFAARLLTTYAAPSGVVPIESLFHSDAGPHVVHRGEPPAGVAQLERVQLVSQGEFLSAAAQDLRRAATSVQRDLRLSAIATALRPLVGGTTGGLAGALSHFAEAAREAIGRGLASRAVEEFAARIGEAAEVLSSAQTADEAQLAVRIDTIAQLLAAMAPAPVPTPVAWPAPAPVAAPTSPAAAPAPLRVAAPPSAAEAHSDLALAFSTFEQLILERGLDLGSLDELLAGGTPLPAPRAAPAQPARTTRPVPAAAAAVPAADAEGVVPIEALLYRGDRALARLRELKPAVLAAAHGPDGPLHDLLHEVFDLVELGLVPDR
ncbi:MAG TPA: hypothetical protein VNL98_02855 [Gemmatimonadales bacterium]|nr:hypothetical protein [Gemmatimonadales bacterium]